MNDHRKLGRELELFDSDPLIGAGLPIWLPDGAAARHAVESYLCEPGAPRRLPATCTRRRWPSARCTSDRATWPHFADDMFPPMAMSDDDELVLRPSLCPHHAMVFAVRGRVVPGTAAADRRTRRPVPGRALGCPRWTVSGSGRSRSTTAHNFCALEQVGDEVAGSPAADERRRTRRSASPVPFRLSLRGGGGKYVGRPGDVGPGRAAMLREALELADVAYVEAPGEAAFYGPKIDVQVVDPAGRESDPGHRPGRLPPAGAVRSVLCGRRRGAAAAGHGAPQRRSAAWSGSSRTSSRYTAARSRPGTRRCSWPCCRSARRRTRRRRAFERRVRGRGSARRALVRGTLGARVRAAAKRKVPYVAVIGAREAAAGAVSLRDRVVPVDRAIAELRASLRVSGTRIRSLCVGRDDRRVGGVRDHLRDRRGARGDRVLPQSVRSRVWRRPTARPRATCRRSSCRRAPAAVAQMIARGRGARGQRGRRRCASTSGDISKTLDRAVRLWNRGRSARLDPAPPGGRLRTGWQITAPADTTSPTVGRQAGHHAGLVRVERLLHLHRLEHHDRSPSATVSPRPPRS